MHKYLAACLLLLVGTVNAQDPSVVFKDVSGDAGLQLGGGAACWADFDNDGWVDVCAGAVWKNNEGKSFSRIGVVAPGSVIAADFDNDGLIDLFAGNFAHVDGRGDQPKSRFLKNLGEQEGFKFEDLGTCGMHYQESYASPSVADYDNDGNLDLFFTTVYGVASFGRKNNSVLFRNDGKFAVQDVTAAAKLAGLPPTYQAAWADYDNDGDLDLTSAGKLFQNQGTPHAWLKVQLIGDGKTINRSAIGAQVRVNVVDKTVTRQVEAGTGEGNQSEMTLHFGLGDHKGPVNIEVFWPNRAKQSMTGVETNRLLTVEFKAS